MVSETNSGFEETIKLSSGHHMPVVGLGTFLATENDDVEKVVYEAIVNAGYRHIDTAMIYGNEEQVGKALQDVFKTGIKREELFITTKLWHTDKNDVEGAMKTSLAKLQLDYVDLYLIHWMRPSVDWEKNGVPTCPALHVVWGEMEKLVEAGMAKSIGVSNCTVPVMWDMLCYAKIKPAINQVEVHPYFQQTKVNEWFKSHDCYLTAYAPLANKSWSLKKAEYNDLNLLEEPCIKAIAEANDKTPAQVVLNFILSKQIIVIPKTTTLKRLPENFACNSFKLSEAEIKQIEALDRGARLFDPAFINGFDWGAGVPYYD